MFKNFLDKAKSAVNDVDNALKLANLSGSQVKAKKPIEYDASFFTFEIEGGPLHSSKLNAVAKIKAGEKAGEIIPLTCTWFITSLDGKVREIEDLTSTSYQPCTEDVGLRISVKAEPVIEGGVYSGMPVYGEVGPIVLDSVVEDKVMEHLQNKLCEVTINIEEIPFEIENLPSAFPIEGVICLNKENKTLEVFMVEDEGKRTLIASCGYSDQYPAIEFIRKNPTLFELQLSETQTLKLSTETSIDRDVIATSIRMFGNDDFKEQEQELPEISESTEEGLSVQTGSKTRKRNGSSNLEILMKRERLIKQIKQLEKDNLELTKTVNEEKEFKEKLQTEIEELNKKVEGNDATVLKLQEEIEKLQKEKSGLAAEKVFLNQEVSLFRSQNVELENIIKDLEAQSLKSRESIVEEREKDRELISLEFQETIKGLETKLVNATMEIEQLKKENDQANQKYQLVQNDMEQKDASLSALQRKIQSLIQENARLMRSKSPTKGGVEGPAKVLEIYSEEIIKLQCFNQELQKIQAGGEEGKPFIQDLEKLVTQLNEKFLETQGFFENLASKNQ